MKITSNATHPLVERVEYLAMCPEPTAEWLVFLNDEHRARLEESIPNARMMLDHLYTVLTVERSLLGGQAS